MPFVALDVDVVLKLLIQSFQTGCFYSPSISTWFSSTVSLAQVLEVFHLLQWLVFLLVFSSSLEGFSSIESPVLFSHFLIKFRRFFLPIEYTRFFLQFSTRFKKFSLPKPWPQTLHAHWSFCPKGKAIIILWSHVTSHVIDLIWSGQFYIITYPKVDLSLIIRHLTYLTKSTFWFNLLNQSFKSRFWINLYNQPFY